MSSAVIVILRLSLRSLMAGRWAVVEVRDDLLSDRDCSDLTVSLTTAHNFVRVRLPRQRHFYIEKLRKPTDHRRLLLAEQCNGVRGDLYEVRHDTYRSSNLARRPRERHKVSEQRSSGRELHICTRVPCCSQITRFEAHLPRNDHAPPQAVPSLSDATYLGHGIRLLRCPTPHNR